MPDIYFKCECGKSLAVDEAGIGRTVCCVDCAKRVTIPEPEVEFDCEGCGETLLAPHSVAGDLIKCASCGHRMTVPDADADACRPGFHAGGIKRVVEQENAEDVSNPQCVINSLMRKRTEFQVRRKPLPEPALSGRLFRLALAVVALVVAGELIHVLVHDRRTDSEEYRVEAPGVEAPGVEAEADKSPDMTRAREVADKVPPLETFETDAAPIREPETVSETCLVQETTGIESAVVTGDSTPFDDRLVHKQAYMDGDIELPKEQEWNIRELLDDFSKLSVLLDYKTGWKQSKEFLDLLESSLEQINQYTMTHSGENLDASYWTTSYRVVYGHAIRTARNYEEAENILRRGWELLENAESSNPRAVPRAKLGLGVSMAQNWVAKNPMETAMLLDELEGMMQEMGDDKVGDIWRLNAPFLQTRFMEHACNVPEEKREAFVNHHKERQEKYLMDDSIRMGLRAGMLRGWIVFLDEHGELADALPVIREWERRYGGEIPEMNYCFARLWVELFGEGDWENASETVRLATRVAQAQGHSKIFDWKNYDALIHLYYDLQPLPGCELKRQRTLRQKELGNEMKLTRYSGKTR